MTSARVENLEFDTGQRERSAHVMDKQPPTPTKRPNELAARSKKPVRRQQTIDRRVRGLMLRKMADGVRRQESNWEIPVLGTILVQQRAKTTVAEAEKPKT